MKLIEPYVNINEALLALDNGGRFYNVLTNAEDGIIAPAELGKVGGLFNDRQKMILFLELSVSRLDPQSKEQVLSQLDDRLQLSYQKYKAQELLPSEANEQGIISSNAIITGVPSLSESKSDFSGFVMVPMAKGGLVLIPIIDQYDVYEIRDEKSSDTFLIAHAKGSEKLPEQKIKVAGVLKELKSKKDEEKGEKKFLEVNYFLHLD
jgi:hypothetical protein